MFHVQDVSFMFGWSSANASSVLTRWRRQGLAEPAGAGVWFNLVADPDAPRRRHYEAIGRMFPAAVVIGATVLHDAGWTTQAPQVVSIAIPRSRITRELVIVEPCPRPAIWFRRIEPWLQTGIYPLPSLMPAAALADALCYRPGWQPDPDDIEFGSLDDARLFRKAFQAIRKRRQGWPDEWEARVVEMEAELGG